MGAVDPEGNSSSSELGGGLQLEQVVIAPKVSPNEPARSTPINFLPVELLLIIFKILAKEDSDSLHSVIGVNKQWHKILSDEHVVWQNLTMSDAQFGDGSKLRGKAKMWFERAGTLPVDMDLQMKRRDSVLPIISYLLPEMHRWGNVSFLERRLHFRFAERPALEPSSLSGPNVKTTLDTMLVTIQPQRDLPTDLTVPLSQTHSPHTHTHDLTSRKVIDFRDTKAMYLKELFVLGVRALPPPEIVTPFLTVTNLTLVNHSTEVDFPTHQAIPFLSAFPALEVLRLSNHNELAMVLDPEYRPDCPHVMPALLPQLQYLAIMGICSSRCVLSHIAVPKMSVLHLIHINSSTEYDHPGMSEPGDSDDEAHDFSRSPWTDHATGMGLRSLFRHERPPLRELIMDYADLRTKDFKWIFERMPELELFYIVASDLSDNVIRALVIPEDRLESDVDADASPSRDGSWGTGDSLFPCHQQRSRCSRQLVLPRLARLKFAKCQKMTGGAVVQMVRSRVRAASEGRVAMLRELALVECSQVTEAHHLELQALVPSISNLVYVPGFEE